MPGTSLDVFRGFQGGSLLLQANSVLFEGRYTLSAAIEQRSEYELWEAIDVFGGPVLIKAWPFSDRDPADEERALWNVELRHLFRLASSPESEEHLVVLRDAGIDRRNRCFVMAMLAPGLTLLDGLLADRASYPWLKNLAVKAVRAELWRGIRRLAFGIIQLHQQQMFHRAVSAGAVFIDPERGPSTMRLGGFELTVRLGDEAQLDPVLDESLTGTYSFEADWSLFGALVAQIIVPSAHGLPRAEMILTIRQHKDLIGDEYDLLEGLLAEDASARLSNDAEIVRRMETIIATLDEPRRLNPDDYLALIVVLGPQRPLTLAIVEVAEGISSLDIERQRQFVEEDLLRPRIIRMQTAGRESFTLVGNRLRYLITEHSRDRQAARGNWDLGFCGGPVELRYSDGESDQVDLRRVPIRVFTLPALARDEGVVRRSSISWKPFLPRVVGDPSQLDSLQRLHDFFRVTNQIEVLMRDAEIFAYAVEEGRIIDGAEELLLRELPRSRSVLRFAAVFGGLTEFLKREAENRDGELVYLGEEDALDLVREVPRHEFWTVVDPDAGGGAVRVRRPITDGHVSAPRRGYLRAFGLFGQMSLIKRRKRAIDRLANHAYLLRALQKPDFTFLDSAERPPRKLDPSKIDDAKRAAMDSIWRTRPVFALQGPPGTGKTTLVASLLAQVFTEDPVAQVLVTAQAHAAVDVLREKVSAEVAEMQHPPLAVRLQRTKGDASQDPDYVEQVAYRLLAASVLDLGKLTSRRSLQSRWLEVAQATMKALVRGDTKGNSKDLCEVVKRAAGITYATTTAGNLAALADSTQTFDWSMVEEAGKAHGFDLVLPLQSGHRWLLIGDQRQLTPYRYEDFREALSQLDETFYALQGLPRRAGGYVDIDLVLRWNKYDESERASRRELWLRWLRFFETVYDTCSRVRAPDEGADAPERGGPVIATMLSQQHRMHPTIAGLVSRSYYRGMIQSMTSDAMGNPIPRVVHGFSYPPGISGRAVVWVNVPWIEDVPEGQKERYTSDDEIEAVALLVNALRTDSREKMDLAILSPYRLQVARLGDRFRKFQFPEWVGPPKSDVARDGNGYCATVDSFQGNQADVVIVSLVRNNRQPRGRGLGFLREGRRMNVLFSRAERLLVLVGSWEFFQHQLADVPPDDSQPLGQWRIALDYVGDCISNGLAFKIDITELRRME